MREELEKMLKWACRQGFDPEPGIVHNIEILGNVYAIPEAVDLYIKTIKLHAMKHCDYTGCHNEITREYHYFHQFWNEHKHCHGREILNLCSEHAGTLTPVRNDQHEVIYILQLINLKIHKMSQTGDELKALAQAAADSLKKIRVDIATLVAGINPSGLTAEEVAELKNQLTALAGDAADVDSLTADPIA